MAHYRRSFKAVCHSQSGLCTPIPLFSGAGGTPYKQIYEKQQNKRISGYIGVFVRHLRHLLRLVPDR